LYIAGTLPPGCHRAQRGEQTADNLLVGENITPHRWVDGRAQVRISIPRWFQLIVIPLAIIFALYFGRAASHAVFVFLMSAIVALLLNPLVLASKRIRCPRWLAVPLVYIVFIGAIVLVFVYLGPPLVDQLQKLFNAVPDWLVSLNKQLANLQDWLARHSIRTNLQINTSDIATWLQTHGAESVGAIVSVGKNVVGAVVNLFLTLVISFYMLIDGKRIYRFLCRLAPGDPETGEDYVRGLQKAFSRYVRGQVFLGLVVAVCSWLVIWVLSWNSVHVWPEGGQWALLFGVWAGITEVIPYVGPFLGGAPPVIAALFHSPWAALIVLIAYVVIQQLESHVLAPNIVGTSVGVHPLLVIFALLAGAQIGGILGMIAALPILAMLKHTFTFYQFKFSRAPWIGDDGVTVVSTARVEVPPAEKDQPPGEAPATEPPARELARKARAAGKAIVAGGAKVAAKAKTILAGRKGDAES
jgi:predicted PurR-regulated permease PerM